MVRQLRGLSPLALCGVLISIGSACQEMERSLSDLRSPESRPEAQPGRVRVSGPSTVAEGETANLAAEVAGATGDLDYEWSLTGRGSLLTRGSEPERVRVIGSAPGALTVTVEVKEKGTLIGAASFELRVIPRR